MEGAASQRKRKIQQAILPADPCNLNPKKKQKREESVQPADAISNQKKKQGMGRRKIEIQPIQRENSRQVAFSKRRGGLFKKAFELSVLCGSDVAIIVFSPNGRPYSVHYGSSVLERFISGQSQPQDHPNCHVSSSDLMSDLSAQLQEINQRIKTAKKTMENLKKTVGSLTGNILLDANVASLDFAENETLKNKLETFQADLQNRTGYGAGTGTDGTSSLMPEFNSPSLDFGYNLGYNLEKNDYYFSY